jgi:uncharacterized Ntn-hydrolase superfamily protein
MTFSIVARDPDTGDLGIAVASKFLAVGAVVPHARAGVGAVATQALANVRYGPEGLALMGDGMTAEQALRRLIEADEGGGHRQAGFVDARGGAFTYTGGQCLPWAGGRVGDGVAVQGNILTGADVVDAMLEAFQAGGMAFPELLMAALRAGDERGGDRRGRESAALLVVREAGGYGGANDRWIDLRVDDHPTPIPELARLLELHRLFLDKPSTPPRDLGEDDVRWLQDLLRRTQHLDRAPTGAWDEETEHALEGLFGVENLEERWTTGPRMDPVAWAHLQRTFGGEGT